MRDMTSTGKFDTRPARVEEWITALPLADPGESGRLVQAALLDINGAPIDDRHRFQLLELFREPALYITNALQKDYVGHELPLQPRKRQSNQLECDIHAQLAQGYKIIANNLVDKDTGLNTTLSAAAIQRALRYLGRVLVACYKTYSPPPANAWREIHQLYYYAELRNLFQVPVTDMENWFASRTNIDNTYKQIVLLAMADPYHLSQGETDRIDIILSVWAPRCRLIGLYDADRSGMFGVNLDSDTPPHPVTVADATSIDDWRILDTSGLTQILRSLAESSSSQVCALANDARTALSREFVQHLMYSWGITPKRRSRRLPSNSKVVVTLGLSSTHYFAASTARYSIAHDPEEMVDLLTRTRESLLSECKSPVPEPGAHKLPEFSSRSEFDGKAAEGLHVSKRRVLTMQDFLKLDEYQGHIRDIETADEIAATPLFDAYECTAVNESNEGTRLRWACLSWEGANSPRMRIGELVSIRGLGADGRQWIIGIIRWMKKTADAAFEFGVQFLAPTAQAVAIRLRNGDNKSDDYQRALLLPAIPAINCAATLVTPALLCKPGDAARLYVDGYKLEIALSTPLHKNNYFGHYQFSVIDVVTEEDREPPDNSGREPDVEQETVSFIPDKSNWEII